jgi:UDP-galactopyranose mutase
MKNEYDYLIVGSGLFGSVCARKLSDFGYKVLVIEQREHVGGNCYTEMDGDIVVHKYGPHIFHTDSKEIWEDVNKYCEFIPFNYKPIVNYNNSLYSFPINLLTLYQIYGVRNPTEAINKLEIEKYKIENPKNLEEYVLSLVGDKIYKTFIYGYTKKQWGKEPKDLPSSIIKRIPIRTNFNDSYFFDKYQGIPKGGYTKIFENLLKDVEVRNNINYLDNREFYDSLSDKIIYTGKIDEYYNYCFGELEYRSLKFETKRLDIDDFQGVSVTNFTSEDVPYTRITEHKHFENRNQKGTVISYEYPDKYERGKTPYYPINDTINNDIYNKYKKLSLGDDRVIFGGRLANYKYYDMHQVWASALKTVNDLIKLQ